MSGFLVRRRPALLAHRYDLSLAVAAIVDDIPVLQVHVGDKIRLGTDVAIADGDALAVYPFSLVPAEFPESRTDP